jgi:hypothetical protein
VNVNTISDAIEDIRNIIGEGLLATGISGPEKLSIVGYNDSDEASGLRTMLTSYVKQTLETSGFARLDRLHMGRLANGALGIVFTQGDYYWGMTLDMNKVNLGIAMNFVVPRALKALAAAMAETKPEVAR